MRKSCLQCPHVQYFDHLQISSLLTLHGDILAALRENRVGKCGIFLQIRQQPSVQSRPVTLANQRLHPSKLAEKDTTKKSLSAQWDAQLSLSPVTVECDHRRYSSGYSLSSTSTVQTDTLEDSGSDAELKVNQFEDSIRVRYRRRFDIDCGPRIEWRRAQKIGQGSFGKVFLGMHSTTGELMAAKVLRLDQLGGEFEANKAFLEDVMKEIEVLKRLNHGNIVRYRGAQIEHSPTAKGQDELVIFMEFMAGGSVSQIVKKMGSLSEAVMKKFARQLLEGVAYLHKQGVVHRDIKGANLMLDNEGNVKLTDFGAAKQLSTHLEASGMMKSLKGTPLWMAPEVIRATESTMYNNKADIWSVGCTLIEMATGGTPWPDLNNPVAAMYTIAMGKQTPKIPERLSAGAKAIISLCLRRDPKQRPSALELLKHPWLTATTTEQETVKAQEEKTNIVVNKM